MSKLVSVEYSPTPDRRSRSINSNPLWGAYGETFEHFLGTKPKELIPVRFPLVGPGSYRRLLYNKVDPLDEYHFRTESLLIRRSDLYQVDKVPVSLYKKDNSAKLNKLLESNTYVQFFSKDKFLSVLDTKIAKLFPKAWSWKTENVNRDLRSVFVEARIYGINTIITTYNPRKFNGVAVQVISRPFPNQNELKEGIRVCRCVSDVTIHSNTDEYVTYLDGEKIKRQKASAVAKLYSSLVTPAQLVAERKAKKAGKNEDKSKNEYHVMPVKGRSKKSKADQ